MSAPPPEHGSTQYVYQRSGDRAERPLHWREPDLELAQVPTIANQISVFHIMTRQVTCARSDLGCDKVVRLMIGNRIGCVPVVDQRGRPIGMITKLDLLQRVLDATDAAPTAPPEAQTRETASDIMMPLAITLGEHATIAHAAALMASEDIHHLTVCDKGGHLIGVVSAMDLVRWLANNDGYGQRSAAGT